MKGDDFQKQLSFPSKDFRALWRPYYTECYVPGLVLGALGVPAGNKKSALKLIEKQKKMEFPVNITWKDSYPPILNENENFKRDFFRVLNELGVDGLK